MYLEGSATILHLNGLPTAYDMKKQQICSLVFRPPLFFVLTPRFMRF